MIIPSEYRRKYGTTGIASILTGVCFTLLMEEEVDMPQVLEFTEFMTDTLNLLEGFFALSSYPDSPKPSMNNELPKVRLSFSSGETLDNAKWNRDLQALINSKLNPNRQKTNT